MFSTKSTPSSLKKLFVQCLSNCSWRLEGHKRPYCCGTRTGCWRELHMYLYVFVWAGCRGTGWDVGAGGVMWREPCTAVFSTCRLIGTTIWGARARAICTDLKPLTAAESCQALVLAMGPSLGPSLQLQLVLSSGIPPLTAYYETQFSSRSTLLQLTVYLNSWSWYYDGVFNYVSNENERWPKK